MDVANEFAEVSIVPMFKVKWNSYSRGIENFPAFFYGMGVEVKTETTLDDPMDFYSVVLTEGQYKRFNEWRNKK